MSLSARRGALRCALSLSLLLVAPSSSGRAADAPVKKAGGKRSPPATPPASWLAPRVVEELGRDCAFDPDRLPEAEARPWLGERSEGESSPLSCSAELEQSCSYDPCYEKQGACMPTCAKSCGTCGTACATSCESCKGACQDDACRSACAKRCASCHQDCVRQRDRCVTGTCTQVYQRCQRDLKARWKKNGCTKACQPYAACQRRCADMEDNQKREPCQAGCEKLVVKGCDMPLCQDSPTTMGSDPDKL